MISIKPSRKGLLHKKIGIAEGKPIPTDKLESAKKNAPPAEKKEIQFAENARHWGKGKRPKSVKSDRGTFGIK